MDNNIDQLTEMLDTMVRMKIFDKIDKHMKYITKHFNDIDFKTCDVEKLQKLSEVTDEFRFAVRDLANTKEAKNE